MRRFIIRLAAATCLLTVGVGAAEAAVCVSIDEARDTLSPQERAAASILVSKQFEQAGEQVVPSAARLSIPLARPSRRTRSSSR